MNSSDRRYLIGTIICISYFGLTFVVANLEDYFSASAYALIRDILTVYLPVIFVLAAIVYILFLLFRSYSIPKRLKEHLFFGNRAYAKSSRCLLMICENLIATYQSDDFKLSCKSDVIDLIKVRLTAAKAEVAQWQNKNIDYIKIAHSMLAHATFDLLASGKYHLHRGMLNPMSCSENLMTVYKASMEYCVRSGLLDDAERKEQYEYLLLRISEVG